MNVKVERIKQLYKLAPLGILGQVLVTVVITLILLHHVPNTALFIWTASSLCVLLFRAISIYYFKPFFYHKQSIEKIIQWFKLYRFMLFLSGSLWASSLYFVDYYQPMDLYFLLLAVFFALSGGAISTLGAVFSIYIAFTLPMLSIMVVSLLLQINEPAYFEAAMLVIGGSVFLIFTSYKDSNIVFELLERTNEVEQTQKDIISKLGVAGEYRDNDTGLHVKRMSYYSYLLALQTGFSQADANQLLSASPMHDVGKIGISDNILLKPGKLSDEEWKIMKSHPRIGDSILGGHNSALIQLAAKIALCHHEKWDGSGYPAGLCGVEIPIEARIVSICDVFDALTSERPYKKAWPVDKALQHIQEQSGLHFDPEMVEHFMQIKSDIIEYSIKNRG